LLLLSRLLLVLLWPLLLLLSRLLLVLLWPLLLLLGRLLLMLLWHLLLLLSRLLLMLLWHMLWVLVLGRLFTLISFVSEAQVVKSVLYLRRAQLKMMGGKLNRTFNVVNDIVQTVLFQAQIFGN
jgi:hypothetical protein